MTLNPLKSRPPIEIPDRPTLTDKQKAAIWNRENGLCWYCLKPVAHKGEDVIYDHKTPRALNGSDDLDGIFPIHAQPCNQRKTYGEDIPRIAKAKRQSKLTAPKPRKRSGFRGWRNMRGEIVWRDEK